MSIPQFYKLDGKVPVAVTDPRESSIGYRVARDEIGDTVVSTVFLGLDHRHFGDGPPVLFETMIFGGQHDEWQKRACTWDEAEATHAAALDLVRAS